jgi:HlyD family secretion protein
VNRRLSIALTLTTALVLSGCVDRQAQDQAKATQKIISDPTQVIAVMPVAPESISETLEITGEITTGADSEVGAKLSGKLLSVSVKDGDPVVAGQLIAIQDASVQQAQVRQALAGLASANSQLSQALSNARVGPSKSSAAVAQAQSQLKSAEANLKKVRAGARKQERVQMEWTVKQAKTNMDVAEKDVQRKQTLFDQGAIPKNQLEAAQNAYMSALTQYNAALQNQAMQNEGARPEDISVAEQAVQTAREQVQQAKAQQRLDVLYMDQVRSAQAAVQSAQAQVDVARQGLTDTQIRAPFSGRISGKPAQSGQIVGPGSVIARIIGGSGAYFEGDVPESQINSVRPGSPVAITVTAIPGKVFTGKVAAISPLGSDVGRLFSVRITFNAVTPEIKPGMFARGAITLNVISDAIMVPSTAVVPYKDDQAVWVLNGKDGVKALPVKTGLRQGDKLQITDGLTAGEKVVVRGQEALNDKSKVRVEERKTTAEKASTSKTLGG